MNAFDVSRITAWTLADWAAVATIITALVAVFAAFFAAGQVREARRTREAQSQPFVVVDIQPSRIRMHILNLIVENIGSTIARNVRLTFEPPLSSTQKDSDISDSVLLKEGIPTLPPGRRIETFFDVSHERFNSNLPTRYDVRVSFTNAFGREQETLEYIVDLEHLTGLTYIQEFGVHDIAKAAKDIESHVKAWARPGSGLRLWVRNEDAKRLRERIEEDLTGHRPSLGRKPPPELMMMLGKSVLVRTLVRNARLSWTWLASRLRKSTSR